MFIILFVYFFVYFISLCVRLFVCFLSITVALDFCIHLFVYSFFIVQIQTVIGSIQYFKHIKDYIIQTDYKLRSIWIYYPEPRAAAQELDKFLRDTFRPRQLEQILLPESSATLKCQLEKIRQSTRAFKLESEAKDYQEDIVWGLWA